MLSRFMTSKVSRTVSFTAKRSFNSTLAKMTSQLYSNPQENIDYQDNDVIISTNSTNDNVLISYVINCLQSCRKTDTMGEEPRIHSQNVIPSELDSLDNKNIKKIVCARDPKQSALSFFQWKKNLLYSTTQMDELLLNKRNYIREYLFAGSLGYTPYSFIVEWYQYLNSNPNNDDVLFLFYEDFIYHKRETITMIADHLNMEIDEDLINMINIESLFKNHIDDVLDEELNEECNDYWRDFVEYHIGNRFIDYNWFRFSCSAWNQ